MVLGLVTNSWRSRCTPDLAGEPVAATFASLSAARREKAIPFEARVMAAALAGFILCCACWVNASSGKGDAFICGAMGGIALGLALSWQ